jgi:two-component system OmpR family sensor kinase
LEEKSVDTIIEESLKLLLSNREKIHIESTKDKIVTDSRLLSLALKNLIDNAVKYAEDGETKIVANRESIRVISKGKSLEHPLEYYLEPFTQEEKRQRGFGLGLYIVHNIIQHLKYRLNYYYKDGYNVFEIKLR